MAVEPAMFIFEVVLGRVDSYVESKSLVLRSEFADVFALEMKDPKSMNIVMPEPPPPPPEKPGKKGKKAKPKKGKKGKPEPVPPEPVIQAGQSVLFSSTADLLIQAMRSNPLVVSLWNKENTMTFIGRLNVPWDPSFVVALKDVLRGARPTPVAVSDDYNIFQEGSSKILAKINLQTKLTYMGEKMTTSFRTLTEDENMRKYLYTGFNSKDTSFMCTMKTTDADFAQNCNKIANQFSQDKPIMYADFKNAPAANLTKYKDDAGGQVCCQDRAAPGHSAEHSGLDTVPDIDFIIDYVRKIIVSCNDNLRMLTPRVSIKPRVKATDIDRFCYCRETDWPPGPLAERFKKEAQSEPCALCVRAGEEPEGRTLFDIANIRGPCGRHDCKIARAIRTYIEKLNEENQTEINLDDIVGPCGNKECSVAEKIQEFLRHEGAFLEGKHKEALGTQCDCVSTMHQELTRAPSSSCTCASDDQHDSGDEAADKAGDKIAAKSNKDFKVYYFTVHYDHPNSGNTSPVTTNSSTASVKHTNKSSEKHSDTHSDKSSEKHSDAHSDKGSRRASKQAKYKHCDDECPNKKPQPCSTSVCPGDKAPPETSKHQPSKDQTSNEQDDKSPDDSNVELDLEDIHNQCCVKSCDAAEVVKEFIVAGAKAKENKKYELDNENDPCFCECVCKFNFSRNTTYCPICGGYECIGEDVENMPEYAKPHPCPVYHKLYNKRYLKTPDPWEGIEKKKQADQPLPKVTKPASNTDEFSIITPAPEKRKEAAKPTSKKQQKKHHKESEAGSVKADINSHKVRCITNYPKVPKNMGWNWAADDIPGMKPRPQWKPGAVLKYLLIKYRNAKNGQDILAKKRRAMARKKKQEMRPTLMIKKVDGEYTVQMEVFKCFSKERLLHQFPYEEKPPIVYTIGGTQAEKDKRTKQRERRERRETHAKSKLIQSTFRNRCQEICLKAYNTAVGVGGPSEDPECPCQTRADEVVSPPLESCSCSSQASLSSSDTDNDEWIIQFTPPCARFDPKAKHPPTLNNNDTQYTYLDYKVKLIDKHGKPVPRFFKGPDGKQECSDLGGFWDQNHVWVEILKDGYIGPDGRWVPMNFTGPDGMSYGTEDEVWTDSQGRTWKIGIDGYIDKDNKWVWYPRKSITSKSTITGSKGKDAKLSPKAPAGKTTASDKKDEKQKHGTKDNNNNNNKAVASKGAKADIEKAANADKTKKTVTYGGNGKKPLITNVALTTNKPLIKNPKLVHNDNDDKKLIKYREIMTGLEMYDGLFDTKVPKMENRACNTPRKSISPFTTRNFKKDHVCHNSFRPLSPVASCCVERCFT